MSVEYKTIREKVLHLDRNHKRKSRNKFYSLLGVAVVCCIVSLCIVESFELTYFVKFVAFFFCALPFVMVYEANVDVKFDSGLYNYICTNDRCLMTNHIIDLSYVCPKCNTEFNSGENTWIDRKNAIFDKCPKCQRKLKWLECKQCQHQIDLDAPYDEAALEKMSNEV